MAWTRPALRFIDGGGTPFERQLFSSAGSESVPAGARARAAERLGISLGALPPPSGSVDGASLAGSAAQLPVEAKLTQLAGLAQDTTRYTLMILLGGFAPLTSAINEVPLLAPIEPAPMVHALEAPAALLGEPPLAQLYEPEPRETAAAPLRQRVQQPARRKSQKESPLMEEVRRVDEVQAALGASNPKRALALLDAYDARFEHGSLSLEAAALRVRALFQTGERAEAARLASRALDRPGSARYRHELESIIDSQHRSEHGTPRRPRDIGVTR